MRLSLVLVLALAALAGCASIPPGNRRCAAEAPSGKTAWFAGSWTTNYGPLRLDQTGANVEGTYTDTAVGGLQGSLSGKVAGPTLTFHWIEGKLSGDALFTLCSDAASFAGGYDKYPWSGTIVPGSAPPEPPAETGPRPEHRPMEAASAPKQSTRKPSVEKPVEKPKPMTKVERADIDSQLDP